MTPERASDALFTRLVDWLRSQGVDLNQEIIRHVLGIVKSKEMTDKTKS